MRGCTSSRAAGTGHRSSTPTSSTASCWTSWGAEGWVLAGARTRGCAPTECQRNARAPAENATTDGHGSLRRGGPACPPKQPLRVTCIAAGPLTPSAPALGGVGPSNPLSPEQLRDLGDGRHALVEEVIRIVVVDRVADAGLRDDVLRDLVRHVRAQAGLHHL